MKTYNKPRLTKEQRLTQQANSALKRKQEEALTLINKFKDLFELLSDAVFLGQVGSQQRAFDYALDVRNQRYVSEQISWRERSELFRLASSQRI